MSVLENVISEEGGTIHINHGVLVRLVSLKSICEVDWVVLVLFENYSLAYFSQGTGKKKLRVTP